MKKIFTVLILSLLMVGCASEPEVIEPEIVVPEKKENITVSFIAAGDNLIHSAIYADPHFVNNGYNYTPIYSEIKSKVSNADIAYINQETMLGGREMGLSHYPQFNSPQEIGDAIIDAGFDWINHATNHTLDVGELGVINTLEYWDKHPEQTVTGIARNQEESQQDKIIEKDGVKFGLLAYTYGTNGIRIPEGKDYLVNVIDKDRIEADVKRIKQSTDSIIVSMHWGTEYRFTPDESQEDLAQFLADLGVDVIIGTHPHVLEPIEWVTGANGNKTLVIYSLGNLLSAQDVNYRMLGGLASWNIVYDPNTKETTVDNIVFEPTVNYYDSRYQNYKIYSLKDYTNEIAKTHGLSSKYDMSQEYFYNLVDEIMGDEFKLDY